MTRCRFPGDYLRRSCRRADGQRRFIELQKAIDAGIKPQSRPLPDTSVTFHLRNLFSHPGTTYNVGCARLTVRDWSVTIHLDGAA
jgi:hypothetical protein